MGSGEQTTPTSAVTQLLAGHPAAIRSVALRLRELVRLVLPDAQEKVLSGWHALAYHDPVAGYVCGIFPFDDHVKLLFEHGVSMDDPAQLLEGTTRQTRHVTLFRVADIREAEIGLLVREALRVTGQIRRRAARGGR